MSEQAAGRGFRRRVVGRGGSHSPELEERLAGESAVVIESHPTAGGVMRFLVDLAERQEKRERI